MPQKNLRVIRDLQEGFTGCFIQTPSTCNSLYLLEKLD